MRDLIFVSLENWDEIWRRNQFVCAELMRRDPNMKILFVGRQIFAPLMAKRLVSKSGREDLKLVLENRQGTVPQFPNISFFNPVKTFPNPVPGGRIFNEASLTAQISAAARRAKLRDPLLWINPYDMGFLIGKLGERGVVYDITDDWELMTSIPNARARIAAQDRFMCRSADLTVVCSKALFQAREKVTNELLLVPNGVDAAHYADIDKNDARRAGFFDQNGGFHPDSPLQNSEKWPRPVFGYIGTLHRERVDLEMVTQLARAHPQGSVVLVGPQYWTDDSLQRALKEHPHLHAPGPVTYQQIPNILSRFDVCIVPHQQNDFVESLNPIKLWEYLACGKPIASMNVAGFRDYPDLVRLADDERGFIGACRAGLLEENGFRLENGAPNPENYPHFPSQRGARRAAVAGHSWRARVDVLLEKLRALDLVNESHMKSQPLK